ncbi:hypothetical protein [Caulobacter sp. 17J65-9]|uniref:hypothetical protein n=1 Tax=Caulobacter sp. 17J65-9 TaxID=2709382 RepID=UPI0013CD062E|nr:hypothetical protein [Caulobacter sp. 17J65-9]NEX91596.1 hypothetical protein [Caulobacter sp. 17J65-9]
MVAVTAGPAASFEVGRVVTRTLGVLVRRPAIWLAALVFLGAPQAAGVWLLFYSDLETGSGGWWAACLALVAAWFVGLALMQGIAIHSTIGTLNGKRPRGAFKAALAVFAPLTGFLVLAGLAQAAGAVLLLVPGLMMLTAWAVGGPALMVEGRGVIEAFQRSAELTRGHRWEILGLVVVQIILERGGMWVFGRLAEQAPDAAYLLAVVCAKGVTPALAGVVGAVGAATLYYELRAAKEGLGEGPLAAVFD